MVWSSPSFFLPPWWPLICACLVAKIRPWAKGSMLWVVTDTFRVNDTAFKAYSPMQDAVDLPLAEEEEPVDVSVQNVIYSFFKERILPTLPKVGKGATPAVGKGVVNFIFRLPNPTIDTVAESLGPLPEAFATCNAELVVLAPQFFWPQHFETPNCPKCTKKEGVTGNGWSPYVRRVAGLARIFYLIQYRWRCGKCPGG